MIVPSWRMRTAVCLPSGQKRCAHTANATASATGPWTSRAGIAREGVPQLEGDDLAGSSPGEPAPGPTSSAVTSRVRSRSSARVRAGAAAAYPSVKAQGERAEQDVHSTRWLGAGRRGARGLGRLPHPRWPVQVARPHRGPRASRRVSRARAGSKGCGRLAALSTGSPAHARPPLPAVPSYPAPGSPRTAGTRLSSALTASTSRPSTVDSSPLPGSGAGRPRGRNLWPSVYQYPGAARTAHQGPRQDLPRARPAVPSATVDASSRTKVGVRCLLRH